jgi:ATP-binding cassette subfamily B protein
MRRRVEHVASDRTRSGTGAFRAVLAFSFRHWLREPATAACLALAVTAATMADVLMPVYAGRLIDAVAADTTQRDAARDAAVAALVAMVVLGAAMLVLRHLGFLAVIRLTMRIMREVAQESFARVQRFAADWHASSFAGSVVRRVTRGMWAFDMLNDTLWLGLLPSLVVLVGTTVMLGLRWPLTGALVAVGALLYLVLAVVLSLRYVAPAARLSNRWDTRIGGVLADAIGCNAVVKASGAELREDARLAWHLTKWSSRTRRTWRRGTNNGTAQNVLLLVLRTAVVGSAVWLWWLRRASAGDVTYVLTTYFVVHGYLRDVGLHINNVQRAVNDMEELVVMQTEPLGVVDRPRAGALQITSGRVVFDRVGFRYGGHVTPLYADFSLVIEAGQRVGLVGHSGSGKTTFVKLIQRLHDVTGGRILIDGQDIATVTQSSLRQQIAVVQQEPVLFHRSLAENIAYARPGATQDAIEQAAMLANAHGFITRLPRGYGTLVGERGVKLSGGERQRVALARAFLADAPILILDEATSSLDSESEALIQEAMQRLIAGRTAIIIAHRLSTVRSLDRILVFERGRVVEDGTHAVLLMQQDGIYRKLFERQAMGLAETTG